MADCSSDGYYVDHSSWEFVDMKTVVSKAFWASVLIAAWLLIFHMDWVMVPPMTAHAMEMKPPSEPTGCPYGDSIPMDLCQKFAPVVTPAPVPIQVDEPVIDWSAAK